jgi:hypothetical protein
MSRLLNVPPPPSPPPPRPWREGRTHIQPPQYQMIVQVSCCSRPLIFIQIFRPQMFPKVTLFKFSSSNFFQQICLLLPPVTNQHHELSFENLKRFTQKSIYPPICLGGRLVLCLPTSNPFHTARMVKMCKLYRYCLNFGGELSSRRLTVRPKQHFSGFLQIYCR